MVEEPTTKDVFRELDGFLIMTSLLSSMESDTGVADAQTLTERMQSARLALAITSQAMTDHTQNKEYFEVCRYSVFV